MFEFALNRRNFSKTFAQLSNMRSISDYSVTVDRVVLNDRTHARYLIEENLRDDVDFDLKKGIDTFVDKCESIEDEGRLHPLCSWVCAQEGDNLKEIFFGAQFASRRGTMRLIAMTIMSHLPKSIRPENAWTVIAVKVGDVVMLCETTKKYDRSDLLSSYSGFKFEQYMTADKPNEETDTDAPVDNRAVFKKMVRSDLEFEGEFIGICCAAEIDALIGEEAVELKTRQLASNFGFFKALETVLQSELADVSTAVVGWKTKDLVVTKVEKLAISDFKPSLCGADEQCLAFLFIVLRITKENLEGRDACEINYVPEKGTIDFNVFPKKEAMDLLTPEFKKKFKLEEQK